MKQAIKKVNLSKLHIHHRCTIYSYFEITHEPLFLCHFATLWLTSRLS